MTEQKTSPDAGNETTGEDFLLRDDQYFINVRKGNYNPSYFNEDGTKVTSCITKPMTGQTLGQLINPILTDEKNREVAVFTREYPISSIISDNVRSPDPTQIDDLEEYLNDRLIALQKYSEKPNINKSFLERELVKLSKAVSALSDLRNFKVEVWMYIYSCIRAIERKNGLFGNVQISLPMRKSENRIGYFDFINERALVSWEK